jgi:hypothetical protein
MTHGDAYRFKGAEFEAKARLETNPMLRAELESLARAYFRLADQADRNSKTDIVYEPPRLDHH